MGFCEPARQDYSPPPPTSVSGASSSAANGGAGGYAPPPPPSQQQTPGGTGPDGDGDVDPEVERHEYDPEACKVRLMNERREGVSLIKARCRILMKVKLHRTASKKNLTRV